jgi:hypothetical protein
MRFSQDLSEEEIAQIKIVRKENWETNNEICKLFRNNPRFLTMKICDEGGDGWEKLCNFLEMDIPAVDFPHIISNNHVFDNPVDK